MSHAKSTLSANARRGWLCGTLVLAAVVASSALAQSASPIITTVKPGTWAAQPRPEEVSAAKPAGVRTRGVVVFSGCHAGPDGRLIDCAVKAQPDDPRLRQAAEGLLPRYRLTPADAKDIAEHNGRVDFHIGWLADEGCKPPFCRASTPAPAGVTQAPSRPR
jgi:hypothetical protein